MAQIDPLATLRPRRRITGMSAVLLPFEESGDVAWPAFRTHIARTADAGLIPAVNMDTGYVNLLDAATRMGLLRETREVTAGREFVAGAFVGDAPSARLNLDEYRREAELVQQHGGTPVPFQSYGLTSLGRDELLDVYRAIARD